MSTDDTTRADRRLRRPRRPALPVGLLSGLGRVGQGRRPMRFTSADAATLGVHTPVRPHLDRPVDARVEALVGAERVVVATGPRLAGSTHALARAARLLLGDHALVRPSGPGDLAGRTGLANLLARAARESRGGAVAVWVDDAPRSVVRALAEGIDLPEGVRLLVTVREELLHTDVVTGDLDGVPIVRVPGARPGRTGPTHVHDLAAVRALFCPLPRGAGPEDEPHQDAVLRAAVLRAAADWDRLAVGLPLSRVTLARVAADHARALDPGGRVSDPDELARVIDALVAHPDPVLRRVPWHDRAPDHHTADHHTAGHHTADHHTADPRLAVVADDLMSTAAGWTAPPRLVEELDERLTDRDDRRAVGVLALHRRCDDAALRLLDDADPTALSAASAYGVGLTALECGRPRDARRWFTALADAAPPSGTPASRIPASRIAAPGLPGAGESSYRPRAAFWLGLDPEAGPDERRARFSLVVSEGSAADRADAASMLAALERDAGRAGWRRHWLRAAVEAARESGDTRRCADSLVELAHLDWTAGEVDAACAGFAEAARSGDAECGAEAMMALGTLAAEEGDEETARSWYRRAGAAATDPDTELPRQRVEESEVSSSHARHSRVVV